MAKMSADSLRNEITNPARTYLWEVIMPNPLAGDADTWLLRAQTAEVPERAFGKIHLDYKQSAGIDFPGKLQYTHEWPVTFVEGEDRKILQDVYDAMNNIIDDRTNLGQVSYKRDIYMNLLNQDGTIAKKIKFVGTFPLRLANVNMDYASDEPVRFTVTFNFDRWELVA